MHLDRQAKHHACLPYATYSTPVKKGYVILLLPNITFKQKALPIRLHLKSLWKQLPPHTL